MRVKCKLLFLVFTLYMTISVAYAATPTLEIVTDPDIIGPYIAARTEEKMSRYINKVTYNSTSDTLTFKTPAYFKCNQGDSSYNNSYYAASIGGIPWYELTVIGSSDRKSVV